jgi:hypothetical protein
MALELLVRHRSADLPRADDAASIDEPGEWPADDAIGPLDRPVRIDDRRPGRLVLGDELAGWLGWVVGEDADDRQAVGTMRLELAQELGELVAARDARRTPEVDDDRSTAERRQIEGRPVEGRPRDRRCRSADRGVLVPARPVDEQPDADGREDRDGESDEDRATRRDVTFADDRYWTVADPVMLGWIVQRY